MQPLATAVAEISPLALRAETALTRSVYGYLPYWVDERWLHYDLLSHIGLFDVTLNPDGSIANPNNFPGRWAAAIDRAHRNGVKVEMVATCFGWSNIHGAIRAPAAIPNLVATACSARVDGINLDFEDVLPADRDTMTLFVRRLAAACRAAGLELTMATPPLNQSSAFDLQALADTTDGLFMMGYDFHWRGCPEAGPVAPLTGWTYYGNLQMAISRYLSEIGGLRRVWFGLPLYGYRWPTYADTVHARTTGTGVAVYYSSAARNAPIRGYRWDTEGQSPWYAYDSSGWNQCWFDDDTSLLLKYREVHEHDFLGAGMWALGYDGERGELWAALREAFNRPLGEFANGDCETWRLDTLAVPSDTSPNPADWREGRRARCRRETVTVRSGSAALRHFPDSLGYDWPVVSRLFQDVSVVAGTGYEFAAWARKTDGCGNRLRLFVEWYDSRHEVIDSASSPVLERDSAAWVLLSTGTVEAPAAAQFARLNLWVLGYGGSVLWDDVTFSPATGVARRPVRAYPAHGRLATVVRGVLNLSPAAGGPGAKFIMVDAAGRKVMVLAAGANDMGHLAPGVYFVVQRDSQSYGFEGPSRKVVVTR